MLRSAKICKKCTIFGNVRTMTQKGKKETRQMTPFSSPTFWALTVCDIHFCIWKMSKFIFMGSPFGPFWSANYLNFGVESCEIRTLSYSIWETYTLKEVKNQILLCQWSWEPNLYGRASDNAYVNVWQYIVTSFKKHWRTPVNLKHTKISQKKLKAWQNKSRKFEKRT